MGLLDYLFGKKAETIKSYSDFWDWFVAHESKFHAIVKSRQNIEKDFLDKLYPKLKSLKEGIYFLAGMADENTVELIFTPEGVIKNIVFVEELVAAAPSMPRWKFTALKPGQDPDDTRIEMAGYRFDTSHLSFYAIEDPLYSDKIDIALVHQNYNEADKSVLINGTYIFLDNYLGELQTVTMIDQLTVIPTEKAEKEPMPLSKLKEYLIWREKEFTENNGDIHYNLEKDKFMNMEAVLPNGKPLVAVINVHLLDWDYKVYFPWILKVEINYKGDTKSGMPDKQTYAFLDNLEDEINHELSLFEGYVSIGRQTAANTREIYIACNEFRRSSKILHEVTQKYSSTLNIKYDMYKDKYWQSFDRFRNNPN